VKTLSKRCDENYNLQTLYPDIAKQWDMSANEGITPDQVAPHSNRKFGWICEMNHRFVSTPDRRVRGDGCPICSNRKLLKGYNDLASNYPKIADEWDYSKNEGAPSDYTFRSRYNAHWRCSKCKYEWRAKINDRVDSKYQTCPKCIKAIIGASRHESELKKRGGITDPLLLKEWDYEKNSKGPEEYTQHSAAKVYWICSKCGYRFKACINNRANRKGGCACCSNKVVVKGINDLATTHPHLAKEWHPTKNGDLKPCDILHGTARKVWWLCPRGHAYQATPNHRSSGTNCPKCNDGRQTSFAEQAVYFYVKRIYPDAINRYKDIFDNGMELDIYIPSIKLAIEYDGEAWHKKDKLKREIKKYQICQMRGIKLFRLKEKPSEYDLLTADRTMSVEGKMYEGRDLELIIQALMDIIDPHCNFWTRKTLYPVPSKADINIKRDEIEIRENYMTSLSKNSLLDVRLDIAKEWHPTKNGSMTPDMVKPYSGFKAWWICSGCKNEYKASVSHRVNGTGCPKCGILKSARASSKKVVMCDLRTKEEIKIFESISDAGRELGINSSNITSVCKGLRKNAGGYSWKYFENHEGKQ
jgi:hypothetical protein